MTNMKTTRPPEPPNTAPSSVSPASTPPQRPGSALDKIDALMDEVKKEREDLIARLEKCNRILGLHEPPSRPERPKNEEPLKVVLAKILTAQGPMTKPELLDAVMKSDYKFMSPDSMNSLNVVLYTRKNGFRRMDGGRFAAPLPIGKVGK